MADLNRNVKNLASGTLASAITSSDTSISLDCGTGSASTLTGIWPAVPFYMTIMPETPTAGVANSLDSEIVKVTAKTSDGSTVTLTVTRGQKNTTAKSFSSGAIATNGVYTGFNSFTATTNSTAGSSVMNYVISSDTLSSTPSEGDTIMVKFPLDANELATLKVNDGVAASIILRSLGGGPEASSYRQYGSGISAVYEKLLSAGKWYSLVYTHLGNSSYGWVMLNSFLPITIDDIDLSSFEKVSLYHSDSTTSAGSSQTILYSDLSKDIDKFEELIIVAFSPQSNYTSYRTENRISTEGLKGSGKRFTIFNAGEPSSTTGSQIEWMRCTASSTGLVFDHCCIMRGSSSQSSTGTIYNEQPVRVVDIWGVNPISISAGIGGGVTPDYSAPQTNIGDLSTTYTAQNPCYLRAQFVAYGPSASSGYVSLVINGQEAQRVYAQQNGGYFVAQMSGIVPVTTGDQIQVTKTSDMTWGAARNAYIIPAKGSGWPNYNSEEF